MKSVHSINHIYISVKTCATPVIANCFEQFLCKTV